MTEENQRIWGAVTTEVNMHLKQQQLNNTSYHISPLLSWLRWLKASEQITFNVAVRAYKCQHGLAPTYLCDELRQAADTESRWRLRSASSMSLDVRRTRLSTVGDRAFPVAAARLWNSLQLHVTAAPSLSIFCRRLKSHLFSLSYPAFWLYTHLDRARTVTRHFGTLYSD